RPGPLRSARTDHRAVSRHAPQNNTFTILRTVLYARLRSMPDCHFGLPRYSLQAMRCLVRSPYKGARSYPAGGLQDLKALEALPQPHPPATYSPSVTESEAFGVGMALPPATLPSADSSGPSGDDGS